MNKTMFIILLVSVMLTVTSCATNGYGCKGRGKIITRVRQ